MSIHFTVMKHLYWLLLSALTATCSAQTQTQAEQIQHGRIFTSKESAVVESRQEIKVICKGVRVRERESKNGKGRDEFDVVSTYVISNVRHDENNLPLWVIEVDNSRLLKSEIFHDESARGKPFRQSLVEVNENVITYKLYSSHQFDQSGRYASETQDQLTINRLTGEWHQKFESTTEWLDGRKLIQSLTTVGSCEKATQKF